MKFRVQLVIESNDDRPGVVEEIGVFERGQLQAENLGLTLAEARELLRGLQQAVVTAQTAQFSEEQTRCRDMRRAPRQERPALHCVSECFRQAEPAESAILPMLRYAEQCQIGQPSRQPFGRAHSSRAGVPRKQVCGPDVLWTDRQRVVRSPAARHRHQHNRRPPPCACGGATA